MTRPRRFWLLGLVVWIVLGLMSAAQNAAWRAYTDRPTILDIYQNAASAKVDASGWVDYLHLAKWNSRWVIVNVLWELHPQKGP